MLAGLGLVGRVSLFHVAGDGTNEVAREGYRFGGDVRVKRDPESDRGNVLDEGSEDVLGHTRLTDTGGADQGGPLTTSQRGEQPSFAGFCVGEVVEWDVQVTQLDFGRGGVEHVCRLQFVQQ